MSSQLFCNWCELPFKKAIEAVVPSVGYIVCSLKIQSAFGAAISEILVATGVRDARKIIDQKLLLYQINSFIKIK